MSKFAPPTTGVGLVLPIRDVTDRALQQQGTSSCPDFSTTSGPFAYWGRAAAYTQYWANRSYIAKPPPVFGSITNRTGESDRHP